MNDELPEGWTEATLGELIVGFESGRNLRARGSPATEGEYGVLKISAVTWGSFRPEENKALLPGDKPRLHERIREGDLLISRANTSRLVGAVVLVDREHSHLMLPDKILRLRIASPDISRAFLVHALRTTRVRDYLARNATGTSESMRNLSQPKIAQTPVLLPPLAEQRRIVRTLLTVLTDVNRAKARLDRVAQMLRRFRQSVLAAACSGILTSAWRRDRVSAPRRDIEHAVRASHAESERGRRGRTMTIGKATDEQAGLPTAIPDEWSWISLDQIASRVTDGTHQPPPLAPEGIPFLLIGAIVDGAVDWSAISKWVSPETYQQLTARCRPERGDVLYTAVGATYGQALVVDWDHPFMFQRHIAVIKPLQHLVRPDYLSLCLSSPATYALATSVARGAAQPTVSLTDIKTFPIPLCSLEEQDEILSRVRQMFALLETTTLRLKTAAARAEKLPQAILAKAFSGELVPTEAELARAEGRTYESAEDLLRRVAAKRDDTPTDKPTKRVKPRRPAAP